MHTRILVYFFYCCSRSCFTLRYVLYTIRIKLELFFLEFFGVVYRISSYNRLSSLCTNFLYLYTNWRGTGDARASLGRHITAVEAKIVRNQQTNMCAFFCFFVCAAVVCVWKVMHKHHVQQQYRDEDLEYTPTKMYFYTNKKNRHTMATITAQLFCATATASTTATIREKNGWSIRSNGSREEAKKEEEVIYCNNSIRAQIALSVPKPERKAIDLSVEGRN